METRWGNSQKVLLIDMGGHMCPHMTCGFQSCVHMCESVYFKMPHLDCFNSLNFSLFFPPTNKFGGGEISFSQGKKNITLKILSKKVFLKSQK